jgi:hypothetical protein
MFTDCCDNEMCVILCYEKNIGHKYKKQVKPKMKSS